VPTRYCISFNLPDVQRHINFADLHRLACYLVEEPGREAHAEQVKNFSVWPLQYDEHEWHLQLHDLDDSVSLGQIESRLKHTPHLGRDRPLMNSRVAVDCVTFENLAATMPRYEQAVEFVSPTMFSRNARSYPLPDPILVHQQLLKRWNLFAPTALKISENASRDITSSVALERCDVSAERIPNFGARVGFTGTVTFRLRDNSENRVFASLWEFAAFSGIGALTTQGLGAVRLLS
jgi:CRISPR-associated endoribonuclease Cas6